MQFQESSLNVGTSDQAAQPPPQESLLITSAAAPSPEFEGSGP